MKLHYYQYVEKDPDQISISWKALHLVTFLVITISGFSACYFCGQMFETFEYNCIFYSNITFITSDVNRTKVNGNNFAAMNNTVMMTNNTTTITDDAKVTDDNTIVTANNTKITDDNTKVTDNNTKDTADNTTTGNSSTVYNRENQNETNVTLLGIDTSKITWGNIHSCNFVQFVPIISTISGVFLIILTYLCGKGGKGHESDPFSRPWGMVFPFFFISCFFIILMIAVLSIVNPGLQSFCSQFENFTNTVHCRDLPNKIPHMFYQVEVDFPLLYKMVMSSIYVTLWAWVAQAVLFLLRILFSVDFRIHAVSLTLKEGEESESAIQEDVL